MILFRKYFTILLVLVVLVSVSEAQSERKLGSKKVSIPGLMQVKELSEIKYRALKDPIIPKEIKGGKFHKSHLYSVHNVVQSYLIADSKEWLYQLSPDSTISKLTSEQIEFRKEQSSQHDFSIQIYVELNFVLDGKEYQIELIRYEYQEGFYTLFPFPTVKTGKGWQISSDPDIIEFGMFLYMKPTFFQRLMYEAQGLPSRDESKFLDKYVYSKNKIRVDKGFGFEVFVTHLSSGDKFGDLILFDVNNPILNDVSIQKKGSGFLGLAKLWTAYEGGIYRYEKKTLEFVKSMFKKGVYDKTPEEALASWVFTDRISSRLEHSFSYDKVLEQDELDKFRDGRITFKEKYNLYSEEGEYYSLIYYNYSTAYIDDKGQTRERSLGCQRLVLKWSDGAWRVDFDSPELVKRLVWVIDRFDPIVFSQAISRTISIDEYEKFLFKIGFYASDEFIDVNYVYRMFDYHSSKIPQEMKIRRGIQNKYSSIFRGPNFK